MIKYRNDLELTEYIVISQAIAGGYFDIDGNYQPHYGIINTYRLFYNNCVTRSPYDDKYGHDIDRIEELEEIIADRDFIAAFEECISKEDTGLTFGAAYRNAMKLVENRNSSLNTLISSLRGLIDETIGKMQNVLSVENLEYMKEISDDIKKGKIGGEAVVDAYAKKLREQAAKEALDLQKPNTDESDESVSVDDEQENPKITVVQNESKQEDDAE